MSNILYVSDLDGTLLRNDETLSEYTISVINSLVSRGLKFSIATARSKITANKVIKGLLVNFPMIVYNGTMIVDSLSNRVLISNYFTYNDSVNIRDILSSFKISPIVYSMINGVEKFSYIDSRVNDYMAEYLKSRNGDVRERSVKCDSSLYAGETFYYTCIDTAEKLIQAYAVLKDNYNCILQEDYYTKNAWLEVLPKDVNKANAVLQLKDYLHCDEVVCFGDGLNDMDMFKVCDRSYAVDNAIQSLKEVATDTIGDNLNDGVANWLLKNT